MELLSWNLFLVGWDSGRKRRWYSLSEGEGKGKNGFGGYLWVR